MARQRARLTGLRDDLEDAPSRVIDDVKLAAGIFANDVGLRERAPTSIGVTTAEMSTSRREWSAIVAEGKPLPRTIAT